MENMYEINVEDGDQKDCRKAIEDINEIINEGNIKGLQTLNIRDKVIGIVHKDACDYNRIEFLEEYKEKYEKGNIIIKTAFGKKWSGTFKYDYDSSIWSTYFLGRTSEKTITISNKGNLHYCYEISFDGESKFSGDTMNSWSTTLDEFCRLFGGGQEGYLEKVEIYKRRGKNYGKWCIPETDPAMNWAEFLSDSNNYKKDLPSYITEFMEVVYTIGNFIPVPIEPESFNEKRSKFTCDYWDLILLAIYEYYMHGERPTIAQALLVEWAFWFDDYGTGQAGWDSFVEKNYMQPFVNKIEKVEGAKYGLPYELWDNHFKGSIMPQEQWQFEQFFVNAKVRILERGKLIAEALVGELSNENKTQK